MIWINSKTKERKKWENFQKYKKKQIKQFDTQQQVPCEMSIPTDRKKKLGITNRIYRTKTKIWETEKI